MKKGLIREVHPDRAKANDLLSKAGKDIKVAEDNLRDGNYDWCLAIAYNSMLSAGRALMELKGYMPLSEAHHLAVVQFCASALPSESAGLARVFNRYRVRRHDVIYGESESVGKDESAKAIENAKKFLSAIKGRMD